MIVMRWTFQVKPEKFDDALELAKDGRKNVWPSYTCRIYTSNTGPLNSIVIENEFKDVVEREKLAGQIVAKKEWAPWITRWNEVVTGQGKNEIWNLE